MRIWAGLLAAELAKLRRLTVLRAVVASLLLGPAVMILALRLVAADINRVVASPTEIVLGSVVILAGIGGVVLSAAVFGREFDLGTTRTLLSRGTRRVPLLAAKMAASLIALTAASLLATALGLLEVALAGWDPTAGQIADVLVRTLALAPLTLLAYVGMTMLGAVVGRSAAAAMLAGLLLFLGDFLLATLRTRLPLGEWLPVTNLFRLLGDTFAAILPPDSVPSAGAAAARLALFGAATAIAAAVVFERQDVH